MKQISWTMTIAINPILEGLDELSPVEDIRRIANHIADKLETNLIATALQCGNTASRELRDIIDSFRLVTEAGELDDYLAELYSWADLYRVWLGL